MNTECESTDEACPFRYKRGARCAAESEPFVIDSSRLWQACDDGLIHGHVSAFSLPTVYYVCARHHSRMAAEKAIDRCLAAFDVCALYRECLMAARNMPGEDFEDKLQIACAATDFLHGIVTRDRTGFENSPVAIYSPAELLEEIAG